MDYSRMLAISAAGMGAERTRVEVAAMNLANANTVAGAGEAGYQPLRVVTRSVPLSALPGGDFSSLLSRASALPGSVVPEASVAPAAVAPRLRHDPGHPMANAAGFITQPAVDNAQEMVTIMSAMRAYEANVAAANATRVLALKALEIGGGS